MKPIVIYYSRKGSNEYLARKIADRLSCDMEAIRPRLNAFSLFLMNLNPGIRPIMTGSYWLAPSLWDILFLLSGVS